MTPSLRRVNCYESQSFRVWSDFDRSQAFWVEWLRKLGAPAPPVPDPCLKPENMLECANIQSEILLQ